MSLGVLAIDPGYEQSAWVLFDGKRVVDHGISPNMVVLILLQTIFTDSRVDVVVIEGIESFGMAVGRETFETVFWTGRFYEAVKVINRERMFRKAVKLHLCQSARAQDTNIRVALMDRFGGTKARAIGIKAAPGPLYGIKSHEWSALAIAVTWSDLHSQHLIPPPVSVIRITAVVPMVENPSAYCRIDKHMRRYPRYDHHLDLSGECDLLQVRLVGSSRVDAWASCLHRDGSATHHERTPAQALSRIRRAHPLASPWLQASLDPGSIHA